MTRTPDYDKHTYRFGGSIDMDVLERIKLTVVRYTVTPKDGYMNESNKEDCLEVVVAATPEGLAILRAHIAAAFREDGHATLT